jgi:hypothetical protein
MALGPYPGTVAEKATWLVMCMQWFSNKKENDESKFKA